MTDPGSPDFEPGVERVAAFDNDGTLGSDQPICAQLAFALATQLLAAATEGGWTVIDLAADWAEVFPAGSGAPG